MDLKDLIQQRQTNEELIQEKLVELIGKSEYVKSKTKKLDLYEYDWLSGNDLSGVDIRVNFSLDELGLDYPQDLVIEALEKHLEDHCMHFSASDSEIYQSTADEIWINTHENTIFFPESERRGHKFLDDFDAWLQIEKWMEESGYFPGIYCQDYHGGTTEYKPDEKYNEKFPDETKAKLAKMQVFLDLYDLKRLCHDNGYQNIEELPEEVYSLMSQEVKDLHFEDSINLHEVKELDGHKVTISIETTEELKDKNAELTEKGEHGWYMYDLTIKLTPNSLHFIMSDDKPKGGIHEMSTLLVG